VFAAALIYIQISDVLINDAVHVMLTDGLGWPRLLWQSLSRDAASGQDGRRRNAFHWLLLSKCHMLSMYVHCRLSAAR